MSMLSIALLATLVIADLPDDVRRRVDCDSAVLAAYVSIIDAQAPAPKPDPSPKPDSGAQVTITVPDDGHEWWILLVFDENRFKDAAQRKLSSWMERDPSLRDLRTQTRMWLYNPQTEKWSHYRDQHKGKFPQIWVCRDDWQTAYTQAGDELPETSQELAKRIAVALEKFKPRSGMPPTDVADVPEAIALRTQ